MIRFLLLICSTIFLFSCSLTYTEEEPDVSHVPELIFSNAEYIDYEDGKASMVLQSNSLEQYRSDNAFYGIDVSFSSYTKEGKLSAQGSCDMISVNPDDEQYILLGSVMIDSLEEDIIFESQSMQWDGSQEQFVSSVTDSVALVKGKRNWNKSLGGEQEKDKSVPSQETKKHETWIEMTGIGFSSSATSMSFDFAGEVSGFIYTRKKQEE